MRTAIIGGERRTIAANPYSVIVYGRAFGDKHNIHDDINAFLESKRGPLVVAPIEAMLRLLYTFEHSVDNRIPVSFDAWVSQLPDGAFDQYAMQEKEGWAVSLLNETIACFFPSLAREDVGAAGAGEAEDAAE